MYKVDDNNVCKIFKLSFENNDIKNGEIYEIIPSNVDEFKKFCEEKIIFYNNIPTVEKHCWSQFPIELPIKNIKFRNCQ